MRKTWTFGWLRIGVSLPFYSAIISTYIHLVHRNTSVFDSRGPIRFFTKFHNPRLEHFERLERTVVCLTTFVLLFAINCRRAHQNTSFLSYNAIAPNVYSILEDTLSLPYRADQLVRLIWVIKPKCNGTYTHLNFQFFYLTSETS